MVGGLFYRAAYGVWRFLIMAILLMHNVEPGRYSWTCEKIFNILLYMCWSKGQWITKWVKKPNLIWDISREIIFINLPDIYHNSSCLSSNFNNNTRLSLWEMNLVILLNFKTF